jgi:hypothetical protein
MLPLEHGTQNWNNLRTVKPDPPGRQISVRKLAMLLWRERWSLRAPDKLKVCGISTRKSGRVPFSHLVLILILDS